jgi:hypothetical protein
MLLIKKIPHKIPNYKDFSKFTIFCVDIYLMVYYIKIKGGKIMARMKVGRRRGSPMPMHKGEKKRELQARMKWLLDFLNTDVYSLNQAEFLKLYIDLGVFIYGTTPPGSLVPKIKLRTQKDELREKKFLKNCQDYLRQTLENILLNERKIRQDQDRLEAGVLVKSYDVATMSIVDTFQAYYDVCVSKDHVGIIPILLPGILNVPKRKLPKELRGERCIEHLVATQLLNALISTINPFRLSRIKTCQKPDCQNYFYQGNTRGKGDYCSPMCKNWAKTKRWRKANPDKYNNYQRAYHSGQRDKAKQDRVEIKCPSCGHRESKGPFSDYLKGYSFEEDCPQCEKTKLRHIVTRWDKSERSWIPEEYTFIEWNEYIKGIQEREG